jgi:hypothetical protein
MSVNVEKLHGELVAAGIPIHGCSDTTPPRIDFKPEATQAQRDQGAAILAAHDPAPTRAQAIRADGYDLLVAALAVRLSSDWATVPLATQLRVQGVIDAAKGKIAARFS